MNDNIKFMMEYEADASNHRVLTILKGGHGMVDNNGKKEWMPIVMVIDKNTGEEVGVMWLTDDDMAVINHVVSGQHSSPN